MLLIQIWNALKSIPGLAPAILDLIRGIAADKSPEAALAELTLCLKHRQEFEARLRARQR